MQQGPAAITTQSEQIPSQTAKEQFSTELYNILIVYSSGM
jgi:hypothetical protein